MKLVFYRKSVPNFGDDLNEPLWPALAPALFAEPSDEAPDDAFLGIGTIIGMPVAAQRLHVFSSGCGYDPPERWRDKFVRFVCVRGPFTAHILGLDPATAITDGAVLTPLVPGFPSKADSGGERGGETLVVPHWETLQFPGWAEAARLAGTTLVDPRDPPEAVIARIAGARLVLTESLHGAILADTYGVPWVAFATSKNFAMHKWVDWTRSVGRDLEVVAVPPPDGGSLLAFGRWPRQREGIARFGLEEAVQGFQGAYAPVAGHNAPTRGSLTGRAKTLVRETLKQHRWLQPLLGCSPERTAEALAAAAKAPTTVTAASRVRSLQDEMLARLRLLERTAVAG